jgi:hypothetical protein
MPCLPIVSSRPPLTILALFSRLKRPPRRRTRAGPDNYRARLNSGLLMDLEQSLFQVKLLMLYFNKD